jgi:wobble nucleotide-excising tRNase
MNRRYKNMELANKITEAYRKAFEEGTDKAWKSYQRKLKKWAEEVDAISPEALEDWAMMVSYENAQR